MGEPLRGHRSREGKHRLHSGLPLLWTVGLATDTQLESEVQVAKFQEELRLEKDVPVSTTVLALGLADRPGGQGNKLEALDHCSAKLRREHTAMN